MIGLSVKQNAFVNRMAEDEEFERRGFELLLTRPDFDIFFEPLAQAGLFDPSRNRGQIPADQPGYYRLPYWPPLVYLEAVAKRAGEKGDEPLGQKVMNVVREVSRWRDADGKIRDNENTWHAFTAIFGLVPPSAVSLDDIDLMPLWFQARFSQSRVGAELAHGLLERFVSSDLPEDWTKACRILYHCTALIWKDEKQFRGAGKTAITAVDDHWLKILINSNAVDLGAKAGQAAADIFLPRLRELFVHDMNVHMTYLSRPAIEDHEQNHNFEGPVNRLVEGLRDVLLGWVDSDHTGARPFIDQLLHDESEIVRRIAIHIINSRFETLRASVSLLFTSSMFRSGHLHELYGLLKGHFAEFSEQEKEATLAAINSLPLPDRGEDSQRLLRHLQRRWLSAIAGHGFQAADIQFQELMSDPALGGLSPHPDFHTYMESRWGSGPTPHSVAELLAFAEAGTVVEKLNSFVQTDMWAGPSIRSLADAVIEAVTSAPKVFLDQLRSFLSAKREYQYAIIAGFKKVWDAWDGTPSDFEWNYAWQKLIEFFENILTEEGFWTEPATDDGSLSPNRNWIPPIISEFLRAGTLQDKKAYDPALLPRTWAVTKILLQRSEAQHEPSAGNALNTAINTSKGKAIEALFDHALRWCRVTDSKTNSHIQIWCDMQPVFDAELAACANANFEFSALCGAYITNLHYLSADWLHENFPLIFPVEYPANCLSAIDGLAYAPATRPVYQLLVTAGIIEWALNREMTSSHARENLIQRMIVAYLWEQDTLDSPRFALLYDGHRVDDLVVACRYLWALRGESLAPEQVERVLRFWDRSVEWALIVEPRPITLLSALSLLTCYIHSISLRELRWLLAVAPHVAVGYNADVFVEELGRLVGVSPVEVGEVLVAVLKDYQPAFDFDDRLKNLVKRLGILPQTREHALRAADRLRYIPGMIQLYAEIAE